MTFLSRELAANGVPESRTRLRAYRRSIRRTAKDVAAIAGVSAQTVLVFERGGNVENERAIVAAYARLKPAKDYGAEIRAFRALKGLTQARLAELTGLPEKTVSNVERRGHSIVPSDEVREALDSVLPKRHLAPGTAPEVVASQRYDSRTRFRRRRAVAREGRLCSECLQPAAEGFTKCQRHRELDLAYHRAYAARKKARAEAALGGTNAHEG